jgi:hypothetical protein
MSDIPIKPETHPESKEVKPLCDAQQSRIASAMRGPDDSMEKSIEQTKGDDAIRETGKVSNKPITQSETGVTLVNSLGESADPHENGKNIPIEVPKEEPISIPEDQEVFLNDLKPNRVYEKNSYLYKTNDSGFPVQAYGKLDLEKGIRSKQGSDIGKLGLPGDQGGHLIGTRFDGPPDAFNIVPQNAKLNNGEWKRMENEWADSLKEGKEVIVLIEPIKNGDSVRPSAFEVVYQIDGELFQNTFVNQAPSEKE